MEMSIREFKAKLSAAVAAVERGEAVTITKHGKVVAELKPPTAKKSKGGSASVKNAPAKNAQALRFQPQSDMILPASVSNI